MNIYRCNNDEYAHDAVIERLKDIAGELELEEEKPEDEESEASETGSGRETGR